jgi:hypothetical protein
MSEEAKYSIELNKTLKYSLWVFPVFFVIIFIIFFKYAEINNIKPLLALPFWGFAFWNWLIYFNRPIKIDIYQDFLILYNIFNKKRKIRFDEIISIENHTSKIIVIRTKSKKILGVNGFDEFHKLIEKARSSNYQITFKSF